MSGWVGEGGDSRDGFVADVVEGVDVGGEGNVVLPVR